MSGIIKTLKTKTDDIEQNVYPKTVLEAVVDSETNETLDNIIDKLRHGGGATYELDRTDDTITLTGSDGNNSEVDVSDKVSKSGDTITGALKVEGGTSVADCTGEWGTAGYLVIAKIEINQPYLANSAIEFDIATLGVPSHFSLFFTSVADPKTTTIFNFRSYNTPSMYYVLTQTTSGVTVEILAQKAEYQVITVLNVKMSKHLRDRVIISYPGTFETTLRAGAVSAIYYNPWTHSNYTSGATSSITIAKNNTYLINFYTPTLATCTLLISPVYDGTFKITELSKTGTFTSSISGTTLTVTSSGSGGIYYKYIELS